MVDPADYNRSISFLNECLGYAVIDSGCCSTVCGREWLQVYIDFLSSTKKSSIVSMNSSKRYQFGDGSEVLSSESVIVPIFLGNVEASLKIDVVDGTLPLLLSKE